MIIYTLGIDIGSTASECIMLEDGKGVVSKSLVNVGTGASGPQRTVEEVLKNAGKMCKDVDYTLATGYDRNSLEGIADKQMSELSYHAKGAFSLFPKVHTVIGIGGQGVRILKIENGAIVNFQMNDKCAAGTERFPDVVARILKVNIKNLGKLSAESTKHIGINSTCTVFAESEVISQLMQGTDKWNTTAGIHRAITDRVAGPIHRVGLMPDVVMTGGVAQNHSAVKALEKQLSCEIKTSPLAQYNGTFGAALFTYQGTLKHAKA